MTGSGSDISDDRYPRGFEFKISSTSISTVGMLGWRPEVVCKGGPLWSQRQRQKLKPDLSGGRWRRQRPRRDLCRGRRWGQRQRRDPFGGWQQRQNLRPDPPEGWRRRRETSGSRRPRPPVHTLGRKGLGSWTTRSPDAKGGYSSAEAEAGGSRSSAGVESEGCCSSARTGAGGCCTPVGTKDDCTPTGTVA